MTNPQGEGPAVAGEPSEAQVEQALSAFWDYSSPSINRDTDFKGAMRAALAALTVPAEPVKMLVDADWLSCKTETDPDADCEAGSIPAEPGAFPELYAFVSKAPDGSFAVHCGTRRGFETQEQAEAYAGRLNTLRIAADPPALTTARERLEAADSEIVRLRGEGWMVAVHNDYRLNGEFMTFWLLTHADGRYIKGEGRTDAEALKAARAFAARKGEG